MFSKVNTRGHLLSSEELESAGHSADSQALIRFAGCCTAWSPRSKEFNEFFQTYERHIQSRCEGRVLSSGCVSFPLGRGALAWAHKEWNVCCGAYFRWYTCDGVTAGACLTEDGATLPLGAVCDSDVLSSTQIRDEGAEFFVACGSFDEFATRTRLVNLYQHRDGSWRVTGCFGLTFPCDDGVYSCNHLSATDVEHEKFNSCLQIISNNHFTS